MTSTTTQPARDPWQPYAQGNKHKPPNPIPEPATWCAILLCVLIVLAARWGRNGRQ